MTSEVGEVHLHFGNSNDSKYGQETLEATPAHRVLMIDRGFCKLERIEKLLQEKERYFLIRLNWNTTLEYRENGVYQVGKQGTLLARVIIF